MAIENAIVYYLFSLLSCVSVLHVIYSGVFEQNVITCRMWCQYRV